MLVSEEGEGGGGRYEDVYSRAGGQEEGGKEVEREMEPEIETYRWGRDTEIDR